MLAIIGFGEHYQRNILPIVKNSRSINIKYVVVRDVTKYEKSNDYLFTNDYSIVLEDDEITSVYILTPINSHYDYAFKALQAGKNVLCEKSLTESLYDTEKLVSISQQTNTKLQEVVMYQYHPQFEWVRSHLEKNSTKRLIKFHATFQIPHLSPDNIRYSKSSGGGALLDLGFYPISIINSLFGIPDSINSVTVTPQDYEVDLFGCSLLSYSNFYATAEWGIGRDYKNEITIEYEDHQVHVDRAFSKPTDLKTNITISDKFGKVECITIPSFNHFEVMINDFLSNNAINEKHLSSIVERAHLIALVRNNK